MASLCSYTTFLILLLVSAIPLSIIIAFERTKSRTHFYEYQSRGWLRECIKWDDINRRFLVSFFEGGIGEIPVPRNHNDGELLQERTIIKDEDVNGYSFLGIYIDRPRNRLVVAIGDPLWHSYSAAAAYDMSTWKRLFLTHLSDSGNITGTLIFMLFFCLADDVAVDDEGNTYITDAKGCKIWKVGENGELVKTIRNPIFKQKMEWYYNLLGLNGIVYHPSGFLLILHTSSGTLFKMSTSDEEIKVVTVLGGSLAMGDGMELVSLKRLLVAGIPSGRLVESLDGWETATVIGKYVGPIHRWASAVTLKEGKMYLNHLLGGGLWKRKHVITEAVFSTV